ncbi:ABC transporter permease [Rhodobium gokarnense]|uniref:Spermidine/putrescine transport system permease protein n=1 Tax=Rhodobium gokarnense TaxID=364296 RepID=A0ABT3HBB6_9HYPH|nr:ABC transporter permease [Rhodobium gokarnense]MCW2307703.1 putative spermidine/putrescine transport system permease protein [Rhodobium gokarnense]
MTRFDLGGMALRLFTALMMLFLIFPIGVTLIVSLNPREFLLPPTGITFEWFRAAWTSETFLRGMGVSLVLGVSASLIANALALPASMALVRNEFRGKGAVSLFIMSPMLIPTTIFSLALYIYFVRIGYGSGLLPLLVGHTIHVLPFAMRIQSASLHRFDPSLEEAARNVGAGRLRTLVSITLPTIRTGLVSSFALCFILSWNDFPISVFLAPPGWTPLPVELFSYIKFQYDAVAAALASSLIVLSAIAMVLIDRFAGLRRVMRG